ncbi:hypothetical protein CDL15_Pgr001323 [Punica granatum]|uniref:Transcription repressor MYB5-like n=1 Tax=Punica granatum TaxID=22663 RepID=A0A218WL61_PUNGR|nr:hypothetical protein CDL15_Pgr001323 [Punica granatum]
MRAPSFSASTTCKTPCCSKVGIKRGPWTPEEDELLSNYVKKEGEGRWRTLPKRAGLQRCGKSCRLRWMNYLRPSVKRGHIAPDEEDLILRLHRLLGNRWSLIAGRIPGRTDNEIKNYWNTHLSKKLINQGIDPRTHKPLNPFPDSPGDAVSNAFVPTSNRPPQQPYLSASTIDKANGSQHQAIPTVQDDIGRVIGEQEQQRNHPIPVETGNWQNSDGIMVGLHNVSHGGSNNNGQSYIIDNFNNEDMFSSFLNTLMDDTYASPYQRPEAAVPPSQLVSMVSPAVNFSSQGAMWDAELVRSTLETLGDQQSYNTNIRQI